MIAQLALDMLGGPDQQLIDVANTHRDIYIFLRQSRQMTKMVEG